MPSLQSCATIFKDQPDVVEVLERCYCDIIGFYHIAFGVLGRPGAFGIRGTLGAYSILTPGATHINNGITRLEDDV